MKKILFAVAVLAALLIASPMSVMAQGDAAQTAVNWSFVNAGVNSLHKMAEPLCSNDGAQEYINMSAKLYSNDVRNKALVDQWLPKYQASQSKLQKQLDWGKKKVGGLDKVPADVLKAAPGMKAPTLLQTLRWWDTNGHKDCSVGTDKPAF